MTILLAIGLPCGQAIASDMTHMGAIDAIDGVFGAGGGTFSGSFSDGADDDWLVFAANAGDVLTVTGSAPNFVNGVLLRDTGDGVFAIGDAVNVTNFNNNNIGLGSPLVILTTDTAWSGNCCNAFGGGFGTGTLTFTATYTGQYGIGLAVNNSDDNQAGAWTIALSGNTASTGAAVPAPASIALIGLALAVAKLRKDPSRAA